VFGKNVSPVPTPDACGRPPSYAHTTLTYFKFQSKSNFTEADEVSDAFAINYTKTRLREDQDPYHFLLKLFIDDWQFIQVKID